MQRKLCTSLLPSRTAFDPAKFQHSVLWLSDGGFLFKVTDSLKRTEKLWGMLLSLKWKALISVYVTHSKLLESWRKGSKRRFDFCGVVFFAYFSLEYSSFLMALYQYYDNSVTEWRKLQLNVCQKPIGVYILFYSLGKRESSTWKFRNWVLSLAIQ